MHVGGHRPASVALPLALSVLVFLGQSLSGVGFIKKTSPPVSSRDPLVSVFPALDLEMCITVTDFVFAWLLGVEPRAP